MNEQNAIYDEKTSILENTLDDLSHIIQQISWLEICFFLIFVILAYVIDQKLNFQKPRKWLVSLNQLLFQRSLSVLAFFVPYLDALSVHIPLIEKSHPFLVRIFLPSFVADSLDLYQQIPFIHFFYFMIGYGILVRYKIPKDRFIRFNIMYSVLLLSFQGIFSEIFGYYVESKMFCPSIEDKAEAALLMFIFWLLVLIPCFLRALLGVYTSNKFMREAVEVHLGRDGPDFIWWDRRKKNPKKPRRPKP